MAFTLPQTPRNKTTFVSKGCFYILLHILNLITSISLFKNVLVKQPGSLFLNLCHLVRKKAGAAFPMVAFSSWAWMQAHVLTNIMFNLLTHLHVDDQIKDEISSSQSVHISLVASVHLDRYGQRCFLLSLQKHVAHRAR